MLPCPRAFPIASPNFQPLWERVAPGRRGQRSVKDPGNEALLITNQ